MGLEQVRDGLGLILAQSSQGRAPAHWTVGLQQAIRPTRELVLGLHGIAGRDLLAETDQLPGALPRAHGTP